MKRKTSVTEGLGYFFAFLTFYAALRTAVLVVDYKFNEKLVALSLVLFAEAMVMFGGLFNMIPICVRVVKWLHIVKCVLFVLFDVVNIQKGLEKAGLTNKTGMCLCFATFVVCVAHNLDQFYSNLRKVRLEAVLVTGPVSQGSATMAQQNSVKHPARMQRKTSITEGLGYLMVLVTLIINLEYIGRLNVLHSRYGYDIDVEQQFGLIISCTETVLMVVGLIKMEPICMRMIKWGAIVHFLLNVQSLVIVRLDKTNLEHTNPAQKSKLTGYIAMYLVYSGFIGCVAHRLDKFYTNRLKNRPGEVLVTGIVSEGSVSTPSGLVQHELSSAPTVNQAAAADSTAETD